jgi:hypothetical protein
MSLSIEVPDDVRNALEGRWGLLNLAQVRRLLEFATRWEAQEFLSRHSIAVFDFDPSELDREAALHEAADPRELRKLG